jgi:hypothetical protein
MQHLGAMGARFPRFAGDAHDSGTGRTVVSDAPFKVGDRVRLSAEGVKRLDGAEMWKSRTGRVRRIERDGDDWFVHVARDQLSRPDHYPYWSPFWELVPVNELTLDQTAQALADAVKAGDVTAAMLLADRVVELCGGTPRVV